MKTFVNGTLYSLLGLPAIRENATAMGLEDMLHMYQNAADENLLAQIEFLLKQLHSHERPNLDLVSEDGDDVDDFEDEVSNWMSVSDAIIFRKWMN